MQLSSALTAACLTALLSALDSTNVQAQNAVIENGVASYGPPDGEQSVNYAAAVSTGLPRSSSLTEALATAEVARALAAGPTRTLPQVGMPQVVQGSAGTGDFLQKTLDPPPQDDTPAPSNFGTSGLPFTASKVDIEGLDLNQVLPYRPTGKLFFADGQNTFTCSASMIGKSIAVTAAHCVSQFGEKRFFERWSFVPGYRVKGDEAEAPFDAWKAQRVYTWQATTMALTTAIRTAVEWSARMTLQ